MEEEREWKKGQEKEGEEGDEQASMEDHVDKLLVYKNILDLLKPGETVTKVVDIFSFLLELTTVVGTL